MKLERIRIGLFGLGLFWFALNLPFQFDFPPTALGLMIFGLGWILRKEWHSLLVQLRVNPAFWLCLGVYALVAIGVGYSTDTSSAERILSLKIPLAAWALALGGLEAGFRINTRRILKGFVLSCLLSALALLAWASWRYAAQHDPQVFYFKSLFAWEMVPAHYLSMYFSFAAATALHFGFQAYESRRKSLAWVWWSAVILLAAVVGLSGIRIQWLVLPVLVSMVVAHHIRRRPKLLRPAIALLVLGMVALPLSPEFQRRLKVSIIEWKAMVGTADEAYQTNPRYYLWKHGWNVIREKPLLGHGTGAGTDALNQSLESETATFWNGESAVPLNSREYNFHSAYMQQMADHGLLGLIALLALFFLPIIRPPQRKLQLTAWLFLAACGLSFLTESMLLRQSGLFFFAFFYALLIVNSYRPLRPSTDEKPVHKS